MKRITTKDPETHSADVVIRNLEHPKRLLPKAFSEGRWTLMLKQLLGDAADEHGEKYGPTGMASTKPGGSHRRPPDDPCRITPGGQRHCSVPAGPVPTT